MWRTPPRLDKGGRLQSESQSAEGIADLQDLSREGLALRSKEFQPPILSLGNSQDRDWPIANAGLDTYAISRLAVV